MLRQRPADEVNDLLVWSDGTLVGFCGIYAFGGDAELAGAVDPAHRRRGIGRELLRRAGEHLRDRGRTSALLVTPRTSDAGREFALAMGATLDHTEHHLELDGPPAGPPAPRPSTRGLVVRPAAPGDQGVIRRLLEAAFGGDAAVAGETGPRDLALVVEREGEVVGTLRVDLGDETAGVYGFAVRPDLRGQGIGRAALYEVCLDLRRRGAQTVTLEVAVDNDHALGLYTSVGFERRTTEDYFAVDLV